MKKLFVALLSLALILSLTGCGENENKNCIVIGGSGPLTGPASEYGEAVKYGAEIAVDEINALGGLQFKLNIEDDKHDQELATNAYATLKDKGIQVSLLCVTTLPAIAVASLTNADGIFALTPSASGDDVISSGEYIFRMCFGDPEQGVFAANYIRNKALAKNVAVIYDKSDDYSKGIHDSFIKEASAIGIKVVADTVFTSDSNTDFSTQIKEIKDSGAELLFMPIYYNEAYQIIIEANKQSCNTIFFGCDGLDGILRIDGVDNNKLEGVYLLTPFTASSSDSATVNFVEKFKAKVGKEPNQFAADAYDCVYAIYNACKENNITYDMSAQDIGNILKDYFAKMSFNGLTGNNVTWSANGKVSKSPKTYCIKNGIYENVD